MLFHSLQFAIFFATIYFFYLFLPHRLQNRILLVSSYFFYGIWDWKYLFLLLISTSVDFLCGRRIEDTNNQSKKKILLYVSLTVNLSILGIFKYYDFFVKSFQEFMFLFNLNFEPYILNVLLPVGISFYTFQTISYTFDVFLNKVKAARNFFDFALYVSFFPQLIAGPIERGTRLLPQLLKKRVVTIEKFYRGMYLFFWGFLLKVTLADNLAKIVDPIFAASGPYNGSTVILGTYAFSIQIYCDFAGYSFMAIGLGLCMGIELTENFRRPYFSKNIPEFWNRWHISLSSWFGDYVFSPLCLYLDNIKPFKNLPIKTRRNLVFLIALLITEILLGFWHGAGWNFGFFGFYHAVLIALYYYNSFFWNKLSPPIQVFLTFHLICLGMLIFRANTLAQAWQMFLSLFKNFYWKMNLESLILWEKLGVCFLFLIILELFQERKNDPFVFLCLPILPRFILFFLFSLIVLIFGNFQGMPFIYFQF